MGILMFAGGWGRLCAREKVECAFATGSSVRSLTCLEGAGKA